MEEYNIREPAGDGSLAGQGEQGLVAGMGTGEGDRGVLCLPVSLAS